MRLAKCSNSLLVEQEPQMGPQIEIVNAVPSDPARYLARLRQTVHPHRGRYGLKQEPSISTRSGSSRTSSRPKAVTARRLGVPNQYLSCATEIFPTPCATQNCCTHTRSPVLEFIPLLIDAELDIRESECVQFADHLLAMAHLNVHGNRSNSRRHLGDFVTEHLGCEVTGNFRQLLHRVRKASFQENCPKVSSLMRDFPQP